MFPAARNLRENVQAGKYEVETTMTTCKNNFFLYGGQPPADHEAGRGCARKTKVVFTSCFCCFH